MLTVPGGAAFSALAVLDQRIIAGDVLGNLWFLRLVQRPQEMPLRAQVFLCFTTADDLLAQELERHCAPLVADQAIELWSERSGLAGEDRTALRQHHLRRADLVLVLLSADLLADSERMALVRHALQQRKMVLPIYLRSCAWQSSALAGRAALPDD